MTHFLTLVVLPASFTPDVDDPEEAVRTLIAPYNESLATPQPYKQTCMCVGRRARDDAREAAEISYPLEQLRDAFWAVHQEPAATEAAAAEQDLAWEKYTAPHKAMEAAVLQVHPEKDQPHLQCEECSGTGLMTNTYNPLAQWDWWELGGRWTDVLPALWAPTSLLVKRMDKTVAAYKSERDPAPYAIVVPRSGGEPLPPVHQGIAGFTQPGDEMPAAAALLLTQFPSAGQWHQRGRMGWFGMSHNNAATDVWRSTVRDLLLKFPANFAAAVDCHI